MKKSTEKWAIIESENACEPLAGILIFPTLTICVLVWANGKPRFKQYKSDFGKTKSPSTLNN